MKSYTRRLWEDNFFTRGVKHEGMWSEESEICDRVFEFVRVWNYVCMFCMWLNFVHMTDVAENKGTEFGINDRYIWVLKSVCVCEIMRSFLLKPVSKLNKLLSPFYPIPWSSPRHHIMWSSLWLTKDSNPISTPTSQVWMPLPLPQELVWWDGACIYLYPTQ